jgi:deoxyribodipyrimidine photo-lyase
MNILYSFPNVLEHALKPKYEKIHWHYNENWFNKWAQGKTGFPVVDAAMTQLNTIGYMENRARLIVASFLVKTLLISWQKGAQYFSQHLIDYDPASNQLNWQWVASSGPDSQPFFRIFNPWLQQAEHDPDCVYIKRWIPDLADVPTQDIHNWETAFTNYKDIKYPKPIVNYAEQKEKCLKMYKDALY